MKRTQSISTKPLQKYFFLVGLFGCFFGIAHADEFKLTLSHAPKGIDVDYTLSWTAVTPSTDTAKVTYYIFQHFGKSKSFPIVFPAAASVVTQEVGYTLSDYAPGTRCFVVVASDSITGRGPSSDVQCHN